MGQQLSRKQIAETIASAFLQVDKLSFKARRGRTCTLANGPERLLPEAIFMRFARWLASTGSDPVALDVPHAAIIKYARELIGETEAGKVADKKTVARFANHWKEAFNGRFVAGAPNAGDEIFRVRLRARTGGGTTRFWFDIAAPSNGSRRPAKAEPERMLFSVPYVGVKAVSLDEVVEATRGEPNYLAMADSILAGAAAGKEQAKHAAHRIQGWKILGVFMMGVGLAFLATPSPAQRRVWDKAAEIIQRIKQKLSGTPAGTTINVPGERDRSAPRPRIRNLPPVHTLTPITATKHDDDLPLIPATLEGTDIYAYTTESEPDKAAIYVTPSLTVLTQHIPMRIEIDFGDSSARESAPLPSPSWQQQSISAEFHHTYITGKTYTVRARVFQQKDGAEALAETLERKVHLLRADIKEGDPMPFPLHPFDERRLEQRKHALQP